MDSTSFAAKCFYWEGGSAILYPTPVGIPLEIAASAILILSAIAFVKGRALRRYSPPETIVLETIVTEAEPEVPLPLVEVGVLRLDQIAPVVTSINYLPHNLIIAYNISE